MASVLVYGPAGVNTRIGLSNDIRTVEQLRDKAVEGQRAGNVRLTLDGKTLEESTPLSKCTFLPSSVIHLVLNVHGG